MQPTARYDLSGVYLSVLADSAHCHSDLRLDLSSNLSMTAADWQDLGLVGRLEWCEQFASHDTGAKPGQPCVCWRSGIEGWPQASVDAELCNPILDPDGYDASFAADDDAWCHQWSMADGDTVWIIQSDRPCECMWWFQRFQWRLLGFIDIFVLGSMTIGILYVWILVTPIWFELGILESIIVPTSTWLLCESLAIIVPSYH